MCPERIPTPDKGETRSSDPPEPRSPRPRGSKQLERWYPVLFELGLSISLLLLLGVLSVDIRLDRSFEIEESAPVVVEMEDVEQTEHIVKPPPPPRPAPPIEIPDDMLLEDEVLDIDAEIDIDKPIDFLPPPPPPKTNGDDLEPEIFVIVEEMPILVGGLERLQRLIEYPPLAVKAGIEGLVIVSFVVEPDGRITNHELLRSSGSILDKAALEAVGKLEFIPGKQRGKPVRVRFSLPVRFRIKNLDHS